MVDVRLQARVDTGGGFGALQEDAIVIDPDDVVRFSAPSYAGWSSPAAYFQFGKGEYPPGWSCPAGWTNVSGDFRFTCSNINGFTPPDVTFPSPGGIWGKWRCALVVNGGGVGLEDELLVEIVAPNGTHDIVPGESEQFGSAGETYLGPHRDNLRLVDAALGAAAAAVEGLAWKTPVRGVAAADVPNLAAFTVAQGDLTYVEGNRVFLGPNQASNLGTSIGIFNVGVVTVGAAPLTRADDADTEAKLLSAVFAATEGTKAGKVYKITNTAITVDTTTITYEEGGLLTTAEKTKLAGVETGADVTDFANVSAALAVATGSVSVNGQEITDVATPTADTSVATRGYVDSNRIKRVYDTTAAGGVYATHGDGWVTIATLSPTTALTTDRIIAEATLFLDLTLGLSAAARIVVTGGAYTDEQISYRLFAPLAQGTQVVLKGRLALTQADTYAIKLQVSADGTPAAELSGIGTDDTFVVHVIGG